MVPSFFLFILRFFAHRFLRLMEDVQANDSHIVDTIYGFLWYREFIGYNAFLQVNAHTGDEKKSLTD